MPVRVPMRVRARALAKVHTRVRSHVPACVLADALTCMRACVHMYNVKCASCLHRNPRDEADERHDDDGDERDDSRHGRFHCCPRVPVEALQ